MRRIYNALLVVAVMLGAAMPPALAADQNPSGDTGSSTGLSTQANFPGVIPETRFKSNVRFPNMAIFGGDQTVQDSSNWAGLKSPVAPWGNIPSIVLRPFNKRQKDSLDTTIIWTTPAAARTYTIPDAGGNASFAMSTGGVFTGNLTIPKLILTATSFNATVQATASLAQATTYTIPDPASAAATFVVTTGASTGLVAKDKEFNVNVGSGAALANGTTFSYTIAPGRAGTVNQVSIAALVAPIGGVNSITVKKNNASNMLSAASFDPTTLTANVAQQPALTGTGANLALTATDVITVVYTSGTQTTAAQAPTITIEMLPNDY